MIYKLVRSALWAEAATQGVFHGAPVDTADGFIHFSTRTQVEETAARHFRGQNDILLVGVDPDALGTELKWEASRGGDLFPHLYGPLSLDAVRSVRALPARADGTHDFSGLLP